MQHFPSPNNPTFTYDIIALICANIKVSDLASLLTISRVFFRCATPYIWRRLPDAQPLLDLIPTEHHDAESPTYSADLLEDKSRLSRFGFYAPFVKQLCLRPSLDDKEPNWHSLRSTVLRRPLLPNLCQLILDVSDERKEWAYSFGTPGDLEGVKAFISPSLLDIRLPSGHSSWLGPHTTSHLLKDFMNTVPELKVLHIYVHAYLGNVGAAFHTVTRFQNLRILKCTTAMVDCEKLQLLGTLPQLESLQIVSPWDGDEDEDDENEDALDDWVLPAHSFSTLRHLSACGLPGFMIDQFWRLSPLVQSLVSVSVKFRSKWWLSELICDICEGSPRLQELSLDLCCLDDPEVSASAVNRVRHLPLRRLRIIGFHINELTPHISDLADLEYLEVDYVRITIREFIWIAKHMPKLRCLSLGNFSIDSSWKVEWWGHLVIPSPSTLCLVSTFYLSERFTFWKMDKKSSTMEEYLDAIAQCLCILWPRGINCEATTEGYTPQTKEDEDHLRLLNQKIRALSQSEGLELPSSESCQSSWMYEF
ncbi:hypothetical protein FS749_006228 [Ceratobasidium sp. UAMH 11750]|nr:hypothetical protein FS749_006228 [Ceratobasidium sp. UAMH 11750]